MLSWGRYDQRRAWVPVVNDMHTDKNKAFPKKICVLVLLIWSFWNSSVYLNPALILSFYWEAAGFAAVISLASFSSTSLSKVPG